MQPALADEPTFCLRTQSDGVFWYCIRLFLDRVQCAKYLRSDAALLGFIAADFSHTAIVASRLFARDSRNGPGLSAVSRDFAQGKCASSKKRLVKQLETPRLF
jgi:hypothetical protein